MSPEKVSCKNCGLVQEVSRGPSAASLSCERCSYPIRVDALPRSGPTSSEEESGVIISCKCGQRLRLPKQAIGREVACPKCLNRFRPVIERASPPETELLPSKPAPAPEPPTPPSTTTPTRPCPYCGETIPAFAVKCKACQEFMPRGPSERRSTTSEKSKRSGLVTAVGIVGIVYGVLESIVGLLLLVAADSWESLARYAETSSGAALAAAGKFAGFLYLGVAALSLVGGIGVINRSNWARIMVIVTGLICAILALLALTAQKITGVVILAGGYAIITLVPLFMERYAAEFRPVGREHS